MQEFSSVRSNPVVGSAIELAPHLISNTFNGILLLKIDKQATQKRTNCQTNIKTTLQLLKTLQLGLAQTFFSLVTQTLWIDFAFELAAISHADIGLRKHDVRQCWLMSLPFVINYLLHLHANETRCHANPTCQSTPSSRQDFAIAGEWAVRLS